MNLDKLSQRLRKQVGTIHDQFYREKSVSKVDFDLRLARLNTVLHSIADHRIRLERRIRARTAVKSARRFMAYRRQDLEDGARLIPIASYLDGRTVTLLIDDEQIDVATEDFNWRDYKNDIIVIANRKLSVVKLGKSPILDLNLTTLTLFGESLPVSEVAHRLGVEADDRVSLLEATAMKLIQDFDEIADNSPNGQI